MAKKVKMPGRIESSSLDGIVTGAAEIFDDGKEKMQNVINTEVSAELLRLENEKQNNLTIDNTPTEGSRNPVTSGGVFTAEKALSDAIEAILILIPSAATALNQLADKSFVESSLSTATATFRGTYNVVSDLGLAYNATHEQIAAKLGQVISTADNNDYCFVQVPESATSTDIKHTERYKFNGSVWAYEYDLNNSGFTADQWAAINSNITAVLVAKLTQLPTAEVLATLLAGKQDNLTFDDRPTAGSDNPVKSGGVKASENEIIALINALEVEKQEKLTFDSTPTNGSSNPVTSGGVYEAINLVQVALASLDNRVISAEHSISVLTENVGILRSLYQALTSGDIIVGSLPTTGVANTVYRVPGDSTYADWMYYNGAWVKLAEYTTLDGYLYKGIAIPSGSPAASAVKMFYFALTAGIYTNFGGLVCTEGINILKYDGANWTKEQITYTDGGVFDISAYHATGGTLATYANLSAALDSNNGGGVPQSLQKGGMSVKYVRTSDNKYVQARLMAQNFTTDVTQWQEIDNIAKQASDATGYIGIYGKLNTIWMTYQKGINASTGALETKGFTYTNERFIRCVPGEKIYSKLKTFAGNLELAFYTEAKESSFQSGIEGNNNLNERATTIPEGCYYFRYSSVDLSGAYLYYNVDAKLFEINNKIEVLPTMQTDIENIKASIGKAEDVPFTLTQGKDIFVATGGEAGFGTTAWVTDYVRVNNYSVIEFLLDFFLATSASNLGFAFYDAQKNYIGGSPKKYGRLSGNSEVTSVRCIVPNGAYYFRTSISNGQKDNFYIRGYREDAIGFNLVYGGISSYAVTNSLNIGDTVALSAASATLTFRVPIFNAKGVYVPTYVGGTSFVEYVVIDKDNKILKKGGNTAHDEQTTYIDLTDVNSAVAIWFTTYFNEEYVSHIVYNNGEFVMDRGSKKYINTISNSVKVGNTADNDDIYNVNIINTSEGRTVTIDFQGECMSNLSLFAKINSITDIDKINTVTISLMIGATVIAESTVGGRTLFQTNDWVRIQRCKTSGHNTFTANKVRLVFAFASGQSADSNIDIQICNTMIVDSFYKPIFGINFDHTWVATETCGVYDELLDNNIPFTITGNWAVTTAIGNKMMAAYRKGLCDIGKYGGNTDPDQLMISTSIDYPTLLNRIAECIQYRNEEGIECVSFGPGSHNMSPMLLRVLIANRFDCVRCGNSGNDNINIIPRNRKGIIEGGHKTFLNMGTMGILFAHGISTNPSEETDPTLYMSYTTFESYFSKALSLYQQDAALILNMKQIAALRNNYDIFGLNLT